MKKILETGRLVLRELSLDDVDDLMRIFSDPVAMRYYPSTKTEDEVRELILRHVRNYTEYGFSIWAAVLKENRRFSGIVGLIPQAVKGQNEFEIGYLFLYQSL